MKILQTLLILFLVFAFIRLFWKAFGKQILRWLGMKAMQRVQKSFEQRMGGVPHDETKEPSTASKRSKSKITDFREKKKVGEYVDFEEID